MTALKKETYELIDVDPATVPAQVMKLAVEKGKGQPTEIKKFRARNWQKKEHTGYAFQFDANTVVVIEEGCVIHDRHSGTIPAFGVIFTSEPNGLTVAESVNGLYCHTAVKIGSFSHNVAVEPAEKMLVQVELYWGKKWTGSYYAETKGEGVYVTVSEHHTNTRNGGFSFSGCPLGRTNDLKFENDDQAIEYAINDFIRYGKPEYKGKQPLARDMIEVVQTRDFRKMDD
jgi:hypothetical protein